MKRACVWIVAILLSSVLFSQTPPSDRIPLQLPRYDVRVEMVGLFASVLDSSGKVIDGLDRNDFVLYEDGTPQSISQFSREYVPLSILFLLDTSSSMEGEKLLNARKSIEQFLKHLRKGDEAMLMEFRSRPRVVRTFTRDFKKLKGDLRQLTGNGSTALYDAIFSALDQMKTARNRRRAILLISDGINTFGKARLEDTTTALKRNEVELFSIGLETDLPGEFRDKLNMRSVFESLTRSAGGSVFIINDPHDLRRICNAISNQMHNQYSLGYYPPKGIPGEWHSIILESKNREYRVVASKTGYYAAKPDSK